MRISSNKKIKFYIYKTPELFEEFRADLEKVKEYIPSYKVEDNEDCEWDDEDLWLTQSQLAEIYDTTKQNISQHIENILNDGELDINRTVKEFLTVRQEGNRQVQRNIVHYNLDIQLLWHLEWINQFSIGDMAG